MTTEQKTNDLQKRKQELRGGFGLERCANPNCSQVLYEKSQAYWKHAPRKLVCGECEREVIFQGTAFASSNMGEIIYVYWCDFCKSEYHLRIPLVKRYCSVCKIEWYKSRSFHLRAPLPPHDPSSIFCVHVV